MAGLRFKRIQAVAMVLVLTADQAAGAPAGAPAGARTEERAEKTGPTESYGGVVLNQTVTVGGQEFYRQFVSMWRERPLAGQYAISVHERPSPRLGSQVWVEYAQRRMFQATLPSARSAIVPLCERAVDAAYQGVVDLHVQRLLFQGGDLGRDEF